jgi:hypothetical protein
MTFPTTTITNSCKGCDQWTTIGASSGYCVSCADAWLKFLTSEVGHAASHPGAALTAIRRREGAGGRERLLVAAARRVLEDCEPDERESRRDALQRLLDGDYPPPHELSELAKQGLPYVLTPPKTF